MISLIFFFTLSSILRAPNPGDAKVVPRILQQYSINVWAERHRSVQTLYCSANTKLKISYEGMPSRTRVSAEEISGKRPCLVSLSVHLLKDYKARRTLCLYRDSYEDNSIFEKEFSIDVEGIKFDPEKLYENVKPVVGFIPGEPNSLVKGYVVKNEFYGTIRLYDKFRLYHILFFVEPLSNVGLYSQKYVNEPVPVKDRDNALIFEYISNTPDAKWLHADKDLNPADFAVPLQPGQRIAQAPTAAPGAQPAAPGGSPGGTPAPGVQPAAPAPSPGGITPAGTAASPAGTATFTTIQAPAAVIASILDDNGTELFAGTVGSMNATHIVVYTDKAPPRSALNATITVKFSNGTDAGTGRVVKIFDKMGRSIVSGRPGAVIQMFAWVSAASPGSVATQPSVETASPDTAATLPSVITASAGTAATPPSVITASPGTAVTPPSVKTAPPNTAGTPPSVTGASPITAVTPPSVKTAPPDTLATPPSVETASPGTAATPPSVETASPGTAITPASVHTASPGTATTLPSVETASPGTVTTPPSVETASPGTAATPPTVATAPPGTAATQASVNTASPGTSVTPASVKTATPGTTATPLSVNTASPGTAQTPPTVTLTSTGTAATPPSTNPTSSGTAVSQATFTAASVATALTSAGATGPSIETATTPAAVTGTQTSTMTAEQVTTASPATSVTPATEITSPTMSSVTSNVTGASSSATFTTPQAPTTVIASIFDDNGTELFAGTVGKMNDTHITVYTDKQPPKSVLNATITVKFSNGTDAGTGRVVKTFDKMGRSITQGRPGAVIQIFKATAGTTSSLSTTISTSTGSTLKPILIHSTMITTPSTTTPLPSPVHSTEVTRSPSTLPPTTVTTTPVVHSTEISPVTSTTTATTSTASSSTTTSMAPAVHSTEITPPTTSPTTPTVSTTPTTTSTPIVHSTELTPPTTTPTTPTASTTPTTTTTPIVHSTEISTPTTAPPTTTTPTTPTPSTTTTTPIVHSTEPSPPTTPSTTTSTPSTTTTTPTPIVHSTDQTGTTYTGPPLHSTDATTVSSSAASTSSTTPRPDSDEFYPDETKPKDKITIVDLDGNSLADAKVQDQNVTHFFLNLTKKESKKLNATRGMEVILINKPKKIMWSRVMHIDNRTVVLLPKPQAWVMVDIVLANGTVIASGKIVKQYLGSIMVGVDVANEFVGEEVSLEGPQGTLFEGLLMDNKPLWAEIQGQRRKSLVEHNVNVSDRHGDVVATGVVKFDSKFLLVVRPNDTAPSISVNSTYTIQTIDATADVITAKLQEIRANLDLALKPIRPKLQKGDTLTMNDPIVGTWFAMVDDRNASHALLQLEPPHTFNVGDFATFVQADGTDVTVVVLDQTGDPQFVVVCLFEDYIHGVLIQALLQQDVTTVNYASPIHSTQGPQFVFYHSTDLPMPPPPTFRYYHSTEATPYKYFTHHSTEVTPVPTTTKTTQTTLPTTTSTTQAPPYHSTQVSSLGTPEPIVHSTQMTHQQFLNHSTEATAPTVARTIPVHSTGFTTPTPTRTTTAPRTTTPTPKPDFGLSTEFVVPTTVTGGSTSTGSTSNFTRSTVTTTAGSIAASTTAPRTSTTAMVFSTEVTATSFKFYHSTESYPPTLVPPGTRVRVVDTSGTELLGGEVRAENSTHFVVTGNASLSTALLDTEVSVLLQNGTTLVKGTIASVLQSGNEATVAIRISSTTTITTTTTTTVPTTTTTNVAQITGTPLHPSDEFYPNDTKPYDKITIAGLDGDPLAKATVKDQNVTHFFLNLTKKESKKLNAEPGMEVILINSKQLISHSRVVHVKGKSVVLIPRPLAWTIVNIVLDNGTVIARGEIVKQHLVNIEVGAHVDDLMIGESVTLEGPKGIVFEGIIMDNQKNITIVYGQRTATIVTQTTPPYHSTMQSTVVHHSTEITTTAAPTTRKTTLETTATSTVRLVHSTSVVVPPVHSTELTAPPKIPTTSTVTKTTTTSAQPTTSAATKTTTEITSTTTAAVKTTSTTSTPSISTTTTATTPRLVHSTERLFPPVHSTALTQTTRRPTTTRTTKAQTSVATTTTTASTSVGTTTGSSSTTAPPLVTKSTATISTTSTPKPALYHSTERTTPVYHSTDLTRAKESTKPTTAPTTTQTTEKITTATSQVTTKVSTTAKESTTTAAATTKTSPIALVHSTEFTTAPFHSTEMTPRPPSDEFEPMDTEPGDKIQVTDLEGKELANAKVFDRNMTHIVLNFTKKESKKLKAKAGMEVILINKPKKIEWARMVEVNKSTVVFMPRYLAWVRVNIVHANGTVIGSGKIVKQYLGSIMVGVEVHNDFIGEDVSLDGPQGTVFEGSVLDIANGWTDVSGKRRWSRVGVDVKLKDSDGEVVTNGVILYDSNSLIIVRPTDYGPLHGLEVNATYTIKTVYGETIPATLKKIKSNSDLELEPIRPKLQKGDTLSRNDVSTGTKWLAMVEDRNDSHALLQLESPYTLDVNSFVIFEQPDGSNVTIVVLAETGDPQYVVVSLFEDVIHIALLEALREGLAVRTEFVTDEKMVVIESVQTTQSATSTSSVTTGTESPFHSTDAYLTSPRPPHSTELPTETAPSTAVTHVFPFSGSTEGPYHSTDAAADVVPVQTVAIVTFMGSTELTGPTTTSVTSESTPSPIIHSTEVFNVRSVTPSNYTLVSSVSSPNAPTFTTVSRASSPTAPTFTTVSRASSPTIQAPTAVIASILDDNGTELFAGTVGSMNATHMVVYTDKDPPRSALNAIITVKFSNGTDAGTGRVVKIFDKMGRSIVTGRPGAVIEMFAWVSAASPGPTVPTFTTVSSATSFVSSKSAATKSTMTPQSTLSTPSKASTVSHVTSGFTLNASVTTPSLATLNASVTASSFSTANSSFTTSSISFVTSNTSNTAISANGTIATSIPITRANTTLGIIHSTIPPSVPPPPPPPVPPVHSTIKTSSSASTPTTHSSVLPFFSSTEPHTKSTLNLGFSTEVTLGTSESGPTSETSTGVSAVSTATAMSQASKATAGLSSATASTLGTASSGRVPTVSTLTTASPAVPATPTASPRVPATATGSAGITLASVGTSGTTLTTATGFSKATLTTTSGSPGNTLTATTGSPKATPTASISTGTGVTTKMTPTPIIKSDEFYPNDTKPDDKITIVDLAGDPPLAKATVNYQNVTHFFLNLTKKESKKLNAKPGMEVILMNAKQRISHSRVVYVKGKSVVLVPRPLAWTMVNIVLDNGTVIARGQIVKQHLGDVEVGAHVDDPMIGETVTLEGPNGIVFEGMIYDNANNITKVSGKRTALQTAQVTTAISSSPFTAVTKSSKSTQVTSQSTQETSQSTQETSQTSQGTSESSQESSQSSTTLPTETTTKKFFGSTEYRDPSATYEVTYPSNFIMSTEMTEPISTTTTTEPLTSESTTSTSVPAPRKTTTTTTTNKKPKAATIVHSTNIPVVTHSTEATPPTGKTTTVIINRRMTLRTSTTSVKTDQGQQKSLTDSTATSLFGQQGPQGLTESTATTTPDQQGLQSLTESTATSAFDQQGLRNLTDSTTTSPFDQTGSQSLTDATTSPFDQRKLSSMTDSTVTTEFDTDSTSVKVPSTTTETTKITEIPTTKTTTEAFFPSTFRTRATTQFFYSSTQEDFIRSTDQPNKGRKRRRRNVLFNLNEFFGENAIEDEIDTEDVNVDMGFTGGFSDSGLFDIRHEKTQICSLCIWIQPHFAEVFGLGAGLLHGIAEVIDIIKFTNWIFRAMDFNQDGIPENIGFKIRKILLTDQVKLTTSTGPAASGNTTRRRRSVRSFKSVKEFQDNSLLDYVNERLKRQDYFGDYYDEFPNHFDKPQPVYHHAGKSQMDQLQAKLNNFTRDPQNLSPKAAVLLANEELENKFSDCCAILGFIYHNMAPSIAATNRRALCTANNVALISGLAYQHKLTKADVFRGVMHSLGHLFGAGHDSYSDPECFDKQIYDFINPFAMHPIQQTNVGMRPNSFRFSPCAKDQITMFLSSSAAYCLAETHEGFCGNGIVDPGEVCDCGSPWQCHLTFPCCGERDSLRGCRIVNPAKKSCHRPMKW